MGLVEASIQSSRHLFLNCLSVTQGSGPTPEGQGQVEVIPEPHHFVSSKSLGLTWEGVYGKGRSIGDSSSLVFWSTKI